MAWSWKLGRIAGIPVYMHWTFLILLAFVGFVYFSASGNVIDGLRGIVFILAIFGCVVLHELGHALTARQFGVPTSDITLLPIGGVARLQRIPEHPGQEFLIAVAGPAVNVLIAGVIFVGLVATGQPLLETVTANFWIETPFWQKLLFINLFLVVFNMLPAFPMDGGRVLRAVLAMGLDYARATRIAASVGQVMAIFFGFLGLAALNPFLMLIALFVWIGAESEAMQVEERVSLQGVKVHEAMLTDYQSLTPSDTLGDAVDLLLAGSQQDFPVVGEDGRAVGVLTRSALLGGLGKVGREGRVGDFLSEQLGTINANEPLVPALNRLREQGLPCLQVVENGEPIGLLNLENIGELLMVQTALRHTPSSRRPEKVEKSYLST